jgi:predicted extracellular nuclease
VIIEGVVVGDFQASAQLRGFFVQEEADDWDADSATSEGIFVYEGSPPVMDVNVGDVVRVIGDVIEYKDELTEITNVSHVAVCGSGVATTTTVTLPIPNLIQWEWYEGMLIHLPDTLYATGNYTQGRYGEVDLSVNGRLDTPTNVVEPGSDAIAQQDLNDRSRIQLEDGRTSSNPVPVPYIGDGGTLRAGDTIPGLTGVLNYGFGAYEVHPTGTVNFTRVNTREATPPGVGGTLKVASFNVLNYFSTLDNSGPICGPLSDQSCRGADNADEFTRQRDKIIDAIVNMDADVIGLMEMENHATDAALQDLVSGLNAVAGGGAYAYVNTGPIGADVIKVAFIYKPGTVTPDGAYAILDSSVDPTFNDERNRPVLAQTFQENGSGEKFTVAVNHLKSKGSACDDIGDPDMGDGQGNCNLTRTAAATALVNWLATDPTGSGDDDFLIIGDLNSYAKEDPIDAIKAEGYTDLLETLANPYSYVSRGQAGYLDHALANASLAGQVSGVAEWHINTDEPAVLDYNDYNQPAGLYNPDPYRASDHDPVIVGLKLDSLTATKTVDALEVFPGDTLTYTIEVGNPYQQDIYVNIFDNLNALTPYDPGSFNDSAFDGNGDLDYTNLLSAGDMLSLSFDVIVEAPVGTILENVAWIMAFTDLNDMAGSTVAVVQASVSSKVVPEPATLFLFGTGLLGILVVVRRTLKKKK